jgi:single-strand DNA-binding protein
MNFVGLVGRVGRTPEIIVKEGQASIANFSLATNEYYAGEEQVEWHRLKAFGKIAEYLGAYVSKGALLEITGRNQTRKWTDKDGNKRETMEVIVNTLKSLTKGEEKKANNSAPEGEEPPPF